MPVFSVTVTKRGTEIIVAKTEEEAIAIAASMESEGFFDLGIEIEAAEATGYVEDEGGGAHARPS